jgi:hypothetical protein
VQVTAGHEDRLNRDHPDSTALYREVRAPATLLVPQTVVVEGVGHVEWEMAGHQAEVAFPAAFAVVALFTSIGFRLSYEGWSA